MSGAGWWHRTSWLVLQQRRWFSGPRALQAEHVLSPARSLRVLAVRSVVIYGWVSLFLNESGWVAHFPACISVLLPPCYFLISCWSRLPPAQSLLSEIAGHIRLREKGASFLPVPVRGWAAQPEVFLNLPGAWEGIKTVRSKAPGMANGTKRKLDLNCQAWMLWRTVHWRSMYFQGGAEI